MPEQLSAWLSQPFSADMPATRWFLFIGFLVVALYAWRVIIENLSDIAGDLT